MEKTKTKKLKTTSTASEKTVVKKEMKKKSEGNKTLRGTVVSTKMTNTVVVAIERKVAHKLYGKLLKVTKRIKADTNGMDVKEGDSVVIEQTRPISRDKNFKVIALLTKTGRVKKEGVV